MSLGEEYRGALRAARAADEAHAVPAELLTRLAGVVEVPAGPGPGPEAVAAALEAPGAYGVATAAAELAPYGVPAELFEAALDQVGAVTDAEIRARLLRRLAPWLPEGLLPRAELLCRPPVDPYHLAIAFAGLGASGEAVAAARAVIPVVPRVQALAYVADESPEPERAAILAEAITELTRIGRHDTRAELIAEVLAPVATGESFDALVAAAEALNNEYDRETALAGLTEPSTGDDDGAEPGLDDFRETLATSTTAELLILAGPLARIAGRYGDTGPFLDAVRELARLG